MRRLQGYKTRPRILALCVLGAIQMEKIGVWASHYHGHIKFAYLKFVIIENFREIVTLRCTKYARTEYVHAIQPKNVLYKIQNALRKRLQVHVQIMTEIIDYRRVL